MSSSTRSRGAMPASTMSMIGFAVSPATAKLLMCSDREGACQAQVPAIVRPRSGNVGPRWNRVTRSRTSSLMASDEDSSSVMRTLLASGRSGEGAFRIGVHRIHDSRSAAVGRLPVRFARVRAEPTGPVASRINGTAAHTLQAAGTPARNTQQAGRRDVGASRPGVQRLCPASTNDSTPPLTDGLAAASFLFSVGMSGCLPHRLARLDLAAAHEFLDFSRLFIGTHWLAPSRLSSRMALSRVDPVAALDELGDLAQC